MNKANPTRQDEAVAARLRKLSTFPVDLARLERRIADEIPRPASQRRSMRLLRPLTAVAASLTLLAILAAALLMSSSNEVMASPAQMAQFHQEILANRIAVTRVDSIEAAGQVLAAEWPQSPNLPQAPQAHVMACCMKSIKDKRVACVLLQSEGTPITMSVAKASDMRSPVGAKVERNGATFHLASSGAINMVSTERGGRWVCLIGEVSPERLITLAEQLRF
jgi:anti-sigma factor RsiW